MPVDFDVLLGIAAWLFLGGFCWLLLLHYQDVYEQRTPAPQPQPDTPGAPPVQTAAHGILIS